MQLGMIGAGRMGGNMVLRLMKAGHECVVYARHEQSIKEVMDQGAKGTTDLKAFVGMLSKPRAVWLMVPAGAVDKVLDELVPMLDSGDIVVDGGNSYYHDDIRRAQELEAAGIHYIDVGVSGGVWGLERGYCQMIGGQVEADGRAERSGETGDGLRDAQEPGLGFDAQGNAGGVGAAVRWRIPESPQARAGGDRGRRGRKDPGAG